MAAVKVAQVTRVAGPLVQLDCPPGVAMNDLVQLGASALPGEVVSLSSGSATVQAYEYTGGLTPGDVAEIPGGPLSAYLGPWLLGGVFDGLLRPLSGAGDHLSPRPVWTGHGAAAREDGERRWHFTPLAAEGARLEAGGVLGRVAGPGAGSLVQVPPGVSGTVASLAPEGSLSGDDAVATVGGRPVRMGHSWPVRRPRPIRARLDAREPLHTGQRVIDMLFPVARGGTAAVPGGFGTGKTMLLQQIAKWCDADVIVYVGCGERGNEMADVIEEFARLDDPRSGGAAARQDGRDRQHLEHADDGPGGEHLHRRHGRRVLPRHGLRHRGDRRLDLAVGRGTARVRLALWANCPPRRGTRRGWPRNSRPSTSGPARVTTLGGAAGSVTISGAVSPPGGDMAEPVTAHTQRFVRRLWSLDRDLAYARHYPAVSLGRLVHPRRRGLGAVARRGRGPGLDAAPRRR